jgi:hypothetical protein
MNTDDLRDLLNKLSLEEKVSLLSGADGWQTQEISRLGIGSLKVSPASMLTLHTLPTEIRHRTGLLVQEELYLSMAPQQLSYQLQ